jgi:hypothetical protein
MIATHVLMGIGFVLKDGAANANFTWIGAAMTVLSLGVFLSWIGYALFSRSSTMDEAANLPFDEIDGGVR